MNTKNNKGAAVQGNGAAKTANQPSNNNSLSNAQPGTSNESKPQNPKPEEHTDPTKPKAEQPQAPQPPQTPEPPKAAEPTAAQPVATIVPIVKPVMSIDERIKTLEMLQALKTQYYNLLGRIADLENFEFKQMNEADEMTENPFTGCRLTLEDGKGGRFTTSTPRLIQMTHDFLLQACIDKKHELENQIVFPVAA